MAKAAPTDHIGRRVKLRELYILSAVVERGSMAKAASYLTMSQPAVSEAIASLEETLRVRLLDCSSRGIEPTIYGQALLRRSAVVFDELRQGLRDIEYLADPATGEVRDAILVRCRNSEDEQLARQSGLTGATPVQR
jgi:DNA-binding transcriptional LysR family regulator